MPDFDFTAFVKSLANEKLVELVLKYAPDSYREEVSNQNLDDGKAKMAFDRILKQIKSLFEEEELLYEPSDFEASLVGLSEKLSGLWDRYVDETGSIFLFCIKKINEIQDEGLPHTGDHHYESIVNSLQYIRNVNPVKTQEIVEMLKREYKRRRNLMAMLEGF